MSRKKREARQSIKLPSAWSFVVAYERADGRRFEKTVEGDDKGRCEACLEVVTINPTKEADEHVCQEWWNTK